MFSYMNQGRAFYRNAAQLALPIILQNLCTTMLGLMDTFMVGALGEAPLAAVLVALPVVVILGVVLALVQRIGEIRKGEEDDAKNY